MNITGNQQNLNKIKVKEKKLKLIDENNSPLFRIMSVYKLNGNNIAFANNICAFHIGKGIVISVAHNLRLMDGLPIFLSGTFYQNELSSKVDPQDLPLFDSHYALIPGTSNRIFNGGGNQTLVDDLLKKLNDAKVDRRYSKLYSENCCNPFLVATFRNNSFCNDNSLNAHFSARNLFYEADSKRYTFLIELELIDECINEDLAIYKIVNTHNDIINKLPSIEVDYELYDTSTENFYCLQTAPFDNLGRIISEAKIEGILDNFSKETDVLANTVIMDGTRYLIKGYFRFGSSGAPYLIYDKAVEEFKVNAVQSQASYIQLAINGEMKGNLQYVNGIASPLSLIETKLKQRISEIV